MKRRLAMVFVVFIIAGFLLSVVNGSEVEETKFDSVEDMWEVVALVSNNFYKQVSWLNISKMIAKYSSTGSIKTMLEELDDEYTYYMTPEEYEKRWDYLTSSFGGVGIYLGNENDEVIIIEPIPDTPAWYAGLMAGDRVIAVDGVPTKGLLLTEEVIPMMRGPAGTEVVFTIKRGTGDDAQIFDAKLTRAIIEMPSSFWGILEDGIGYLRIYQFTYNTTDEVLRAMSEFASEDVKGVILDLRYNPGGFLQSAYDISCIFISQGPIFHIIGRDLNQKTTYYSQPTTIVDYPLVVLVNTGSASATEILAGALQDTKRATLVGTQTYGKGVVQHIAKLRSGAGLSVTIAEYLTAGDRHINKVGLTPDVVIDFPPYTDEELEQMTEEEFVDVQLERALEIMRNEIMNKETTLPKAG